MEVDGMKVYVQWSDHRVACESVLGLRDFDALIADHQKKLNTHLATLKKLEEL